jgi:hypothetical protein
VVQALFTDEAMATEKLWYRSSHYICYGGCLYKMSLDLYWIAKFLLISIFLDGMLLCVSKTNESKPSAQHYSEIIIRSFTEASGRPCRSSGGQSPVLTAEARGSRLGQSM